jgi:hypothetical protein
MSHHFSMRYLPGEASTRVSTTVETIQVKLGYRAKDNQYFAQIGTSIWNSHDGNYCGPNAGLTNLALKVARSDPTLKHTFQVIGATIAVKQRKGHSVPMQGVVPVTTLEKLDYLRERIGNEQRHLAFEANCSKEELQRTPIPLERYTIVHRRI